jgi:NAD(P)-dependent dehydrogenase (short-subunit alcohol dehydrogenase family)
MSPQLDLSGRRALITGASRGIGREIALAFGEYGAAVAVNFSSDRACADEVVARILAQGGRAFAVQGDASDPAAVAQMTEATAAAFGGSIDIAVANVGPFRLAPLAALDVDDFDRIVRSNLSSAFYLAKAVLPAMRLKNDGVILTVGLDSVSHAIDGAPHVAAYACAKAALASLTRSMASEFAPLGIRVAMVAPGLIGHEGLNPVQARWMAARVPAGRLGAPREVADACAFLSSDLARYCGGAVLGVGGGWDWSRDRSTAFDTQEVVGALTAGH